MPWKVVERKIGRAGGVKQRTARQREWDRQVRRGQLGGRLRHRRRLRPAGRRPGVDLQPELRGTLRRPPRGPGGTDPPRQEPAEPARRGDDRRGPASAGDHGLPGAARASASGTEVVDIGSWKGQASHPISIRLSPLHIQVVGDPKMTLEQFWQERKCLAVWEEESG